MTRDGYAALVLAALRLRLGLLDIATEAPTPTSLLLKHLPLVESAITVNHRQISYGHYLIYSIWITGHRRNSSSTLRAH